MKKIFIPQETKGLIFDCDGTLVDSMPLHLEAWKHAFKKNDLYYNKDFLYSLKGMKEEEIITLYNKEFKTEINPKMIVKMKHEYFLQNIEKVKPIVSIVNIAKENYKKLPLAVVSGSIGNIVKKELDVLGIYYLFDFILTADDPYKPKPDPEIFYAAAAKMKLNPEDCIVFEDGDAGLIAASKTGMKTVDILKYID